MLGRDEIFGLVHPYNDVHTLGTYNAGKILQDCGYKVFYADELVSRAIEEINRNDNVQVLVKWIKENKITRLGFSYRLDPNDAQLYFGRTYHLLKEKKCFDFQDGPLRQIYFAGLPQSCELIRQEYGGDILTFWGDETRLETLRKLGVPDYLISSSVLCSSKYDDDRFAFASDLLKKGDYKFQKPIYRGTYPNYGTINDTVAERIVNNRKYTNLPLIRVHAGPYNPNYNEAKKEFLSWLKTLAETKFLDIISIGTSQLTQSNFGEEWGEKHNGGGVPLNSESDYYEVWKAARPMLVRTYAGTKDIRQLAEMYEKTINISWHALSFWWFNELDGRGAYSVKDNLKQHFETVKYIAQTSKPLEANVPHHFAFRGGDDYTYILSGYLAAKAAKKMGIRHFVVQTMLNTPKYTWGVQDLAKARTLIKLVRELESENFVVYLQPRAGLDYFSPDLEKAKIQLASVTAMMDDIEPDNPNSPDIVHVVSYCEAVKLATPEFINESIQIAISSLDAYRECKRRNGFDMSFEDDVQRRCEVMYSKIKNIVGMLERSITDLYSPAGFYEIFKLGILTAPYLWNCRDEYADVVKWNTDFVDGGVAVVDENGNVIDPVERIEGILEKREVLMLETNCCSI